MYNTFNSSIRFYESPVIADNRIDNSGLFNSGVRAVASKIYEIYFNTRKASENNNDFYDSKRKDHYIIFKNSQIMSIHHYTSGMINKAKNLLRQVGLIKTVPQKWNQPDRIYLPDFKKIFNFMTNKTSGRSHVESHNNKTSKIKHTSNNTKVNTKTAYKPQKFNSMDKTFEWSDSVKTLGLTLDTINNIAKFSDTYNKSAYKITKFIIEARDIIANKNHISKQKRGFETNSNIKNHLGSKIWKLLSYIASPKHPEVKLSNFAGWFINSLKNFFYGAFGLKQDKPTVTPNVPSHHKVIKESLPKWYVDQRQGKNEHLHKTSSKLQKEIKERLADLH